MIDTALTLTIGIVVVVFAIATFCRDLTRAPYYGRLPRRRRWRRH